MAPPQQTLGLVLGWAMSSVVLRGTALALRPRAVFPSALRRLRMSTAATANPLLTAATDPLPRYEAMTPAHVEPALTDLLAQLDAEYTAFEARLAAPDTPPADRSYAAVVEGLERLEFPLSIAWSAVNHLMGVANSDELRSAHSAVQPEVVKATQRLGQSRPVYDALNALRNDEEAWGQLSGSQQRVVESALRGMRHRGVSLDAEVREEFNAISLELADLSTRFSNNVLDATKAFELLVTDPAGVEGLPPSALALAAQTAAAKGHEGATPEDGPWMLTLDAPSYVPAMQHLKSRELREQMYRAYLTRAADANAEIIDRILVLRKRKAAMLGFETHAELSLASKMADSVQAVDDMGKLLYDRAYPAAQRELEAVARFAAEAGGMPEGEALKPWDVPYWAERQREALYGFKEEELKPYLPLPAVLDGLFALATRIFGVRVEEADGEAGVWDPSVRFFKVLDDATGEHVASFYLDPFARPENKRGGAWMDIVMGKSRATGRSPVAQMVCNGSPPVGDVPSLMSFRDVETLFHEMGHCLQHMLTRVEEGDASGINGVEWDAVELPSQFMENWCLERKCITSFAKHYSTGEPLPEELYQKLLQQRHYNAGMQICRQLSFMTIDMELHHRYDPENPSMTPLELQRKVFEKYSVVAPIAEDAFLCGFGHIFAGGYAAGYYSYLWAELMSADAFGAFEEAGLEDEEQVRTVGRRFRDTVLAQGGAMHPSEVYRAFRGRDPTPEALLRHRGLVTADA